ncbi:unnamed protein product [Paramecium sonneborni]|uniref:Uncharacterized protein n=1 Tax=Paramecium sonneborni TaxID=65129 RepID=A0A8S1NXE6_9CILI|nr:unnamed protein product [Paramecium sonneborni]
MKHGNQKKMNLVNENKKHNQDNQKNILIDVEEFMIELDFLDQKQERQAKQQKGSINKIYNKIENVVQEKNKHKNLVFDSDRQGNRQKLHNPQSSDKDQNKQYEEEMIQEEQKQEKEKQYKTDYMIENRKKDCQDLSNIQKTSKVLIIQDDLEENKTEKLNLVFQTQKNGNECYKQVLNEQKLTSNNKMEQIKEAKQQNFAEEQSGQNLTCQFQSKQNQLMKIKQKNPQKFVIQSNGNSKKHKKLATMIVDAYMQTDDTSDIHGQEILNLIISEQNMVYQLNQLHDKILRLLNNQI